MSGKEISDEDNKIGGHDKKDTDQKKEVKPEDSPNAEKYWLDAKPRQVKRMSLDASVEPDQIINRMNERIVCVRHGLATVIRPRLGGPILTLRS
jgi:hypothetical protein